jgi:hypothetical protein
MNEESRPARRLPNHNVTALNLARAGDADLEQGAVGVVEGLPPYEPGRSRGDSQQRRKGEGA